jgi:DUF2075 family protein
VPEVKTYDQVFILDIYYRRESGVSQASRRVAQEIEKDKKLIKKTDEIKKKLIMSRMKTLLFSLLTKGVFTEK